MKEYTTLTESSYPTFLVQHERHWYTGSSVTWSKKREEARGSSTIDKWMFIRRSSTVPAKFVGLKAVVDLAEDDADGVFTNRWGKRVEGIGVRSDRKVTGIEGPIYRFAAKVGKPSRTSNKRIARRAKARRQARRY